MRFVGSLLIAALAMGTATTGQQSDVGRQPTRKEKLVLDQRNREDLHEGSDPFHIVGLEQADNGFRDRTPTLQATDGNVTKVDTEELRQRQIAMLTGRSLFRRPPASASSTGHGMSPGQDPHIQNGAEIARQGREEEQEEDGASVLVIAACALGCGLVALAAKKLAL